MEIRAAESQDVDRIRQIAEQSFQTSYSLSPDQIDTILAEIFSDEALTEHIESDSGRIFVITDEDETIGFVDVIREDYLFLRWLHVDPENRGQGAGTALLEHVQGEAADQTLPLVGRVLAEDDEGESFCEQFGFERSEKTKLEFAHETFFEYSYVDSNTMASVTDEFSGDVPETVTSEGKTLSVDSDEKTPGTDGLFFRTYEEHGGESYGYYCSNCGSADVGSDSLGRLECQSCGNKHLADEWDAAYL